MHRDVDFGAQPLDELRVGEEPAVVQRGQGQLLRQQHIGIGGLRCGLQCHASLLGDGHRADATADAMVQRPSLRAPTSAPVADCVD
ncbi:MAG: hypothetical protein QOI89_3310, partial [Solirubrobacteraceae bacterium]|nr:hypothetical protein [Solirubrobacteraceae bacterium]